MKIYRIILTIIGCIILLNGFIMSFTTNMNTGYVLAIMLGLFLVLYGMLFKQIKSRFPKWIKTSIALFLIMLIISGLSLFVWGSRDNVNYHEDAVVVLGAGLRGDTPTVTLSERLNVAIEYHKKNPYAIIVVSGGQGPQETVSEASAMEKYLISRGVPKERIIKEDKSTSTYENFMFSKEILDNRYAREYDVTYITNEYHVYRAGCLAKHAGLNRISHISSSTRWYSIVPSTLRECLAVVKYWMLGS